MLFDETLWYGIPVGSNANLVPPTEKNSKELLASLASRSYCRGVKAKELIHVGFLVSKKNKERLKKKARAERRSVNQVVIRTLIGAGLILDED